MKLKHLAAGLGLALIGLAGPAQATDLATDVTVGGVSAPGGHPVTAASTGSITFAGEKTAAAGGGYLPLACGSMSIPASPVSTVASGTGVTDLAGVAKARFLTCIWPFGGSL